MRKTHNNVVIVTALFDYLERTERGKVCFCWQQVPLTYSVFFLTSYNLVYSSYCMIKDVSVRWFCWTDASHWRVSSLYSVSSRMRPVFPWTQRPWQGDQTCSGGIVRWNSSSSCGCMFDNLIFKFCLNSRLLYNIFQIWN